MLGSSELIESAKTAMAKGRFEEAVALCGRALESDPTDFEAAILAASSAVKAGNFELAIQFAGTAILLQPDDSTGYSVLGRCFMAMRQPERAVEQLSKALTLDQGQPIQYFLLAQALQQANRDFEAIDAYRQAIQMAPSIADSYVALGQLYIKVGNRSEASLCFRRAYKLEPNTVRGLTQLAKALIEDGKYSEAEQALKQAIDRDPKAPIPYALMGQVLQQLGRFDEAAGSLRKAIEIQPLAARPYQQFALSKRITELDRPLIAQMTALVSDPRFSDDERRHLHFALGKAHDDLGEFSDAIVHFDAGNEIMLRLAPPFDRETHTYQFDLAIQALSAEFIRENAAIGSNSDAPVFIVGMIRSGTTLVEQIVSSHPEVAAGGEIGFWLENTRNTLDDSQTALDPERIPSVADAYLRLLEPIRAGKRRVTDKMPLNYMFLGAIHLAFPNARIIHCRRSPLDNCLSMYLTPFPQPVNFVHSRENIAFYYKEYQRLMEHWRQVIPANRMLEIDYEELIDNCEGSTHRLIEFLGLDWDDTCLHPEQNERAVRTPSMWQVRQPVYRTSVERWRNYEPWLGALKDLVRV